MSTNLRESELIAHARLLTKVGRCLQAMEQGKEPMNSMLYMATAKMAKKLIELIGESDVGAGVVLSIPALLEMVEGSEVTLDHDRLMALLRGDQSPAAPEGPAPQ